MRNLVFGTCYVNSPHRAKLLDCWITVIRRVNPNTDILLVDSNSPWEPLIDPRHGHFARYDTGMRMSRMLHSFPDNVGHLSHKGRDGWGRAFCYGLEAAIAGKYDYVAHIEGDSLFRLPVEPIFATMNRDGIHAASIPVGGTKRTMYGWVETGLMFFSTNFVDHIHFVRQYSWQHRTTNPTPEVVIRQILGNDLRMMPWRGERGDKSHITPANVTQLDWVTHCWDKDDVYAAFVRSIKEPQSCR
jgi:hypothetical protein